MAPVVNGLKDDYDGTVAIRMYNVGTSSAGNALADKYGVQYVPTFVFVDSDGEYVDMIIGETTEATLRKTLDSLD